MTIDFILSEILPFLLVVVFIVPILKAAKKAKDKDMPASGTSKSQGHGNSASAIEDIVCSFDNHVNHAGYVNPNSNKLQDELLYRQLLRALESQKTYQAMQDLLQKYQNLLSSEMYFRLNNDLEKIRQKRNLY